MKTELFPHLETIGEPESDTATIERPDAVEDNSQKAGSGYRVLLYNDDHSEVDDVIKQIIKATQCSVDKAVQIMLEAHHKGRAICFRGAREKCQRVANVLREIRLQCEVDCD